MSTKKNRILTTEEQKMLDITDTLKEVTERAQDIAKGNPDVQVLISQLKGNLLHVAAKRGISVKESIDVSAKLIVLSTLAK